MEGGVPKDRTGERARNKGGHLFCQDGDVWKLRVGWSREELGLED